MNNQSVQRQHSKWQRILPFLPKNKRTTTETHDSIPVTNASKKSSTSFFDRLLISLDPICAILPPVLTCAL
jgi:hypothetical protein